MKYTIKISRAENGWIMEVTWPDTNETRVWISLDIAGMGTVLAQLDAEVPAP